MLHLLERLPREELRGVEVGRVVEPVTDLDAGDLAVEELVEHPLEERAIARRVELGAAEIERHLLARQQHDKSVLLLRATGQALDRRPDALILRALRDEAGDLLAVRHDALQLVLGELLAVACAPAARPGSAPDCR